ncbi:MAG TPA: peptidoglycan DD-metalloendopeptidase family protein [Calditrichia bacterium]|nr:peptidoglycan DD-metalloendopeptidase family protein [Calditrichota bacterium]HQV32255.1 peptidoglycan DD-metalloendopeptidase family protein [Calditrichia bacterium]
MEKKPLLIYVDHKSSNVREYNLSFKKIGLGVGILLFAAVAFFVYMVTVFSDFTQNSRISQLRNENRILRSELAQISEKITGIRSNIDQLVQQDDKIRTMLDLPAITSDVRQVGIGGTDPVLNRTAELSELSFGAELLENLQLIERLEREVRLEKNSYQKLLTTVERREDSLRYLPVLKPVPSSYLTSSFGNRIHPIYKRRMFHKGIDLGAKRGTAIIAPADGYVVSAGKNGGYGNFVALDHKYGFETYYGHMHQIYVRKGQFVKRGEKIGEVGRTGLATSTHLHYEVRYKGNPLNPTDFFLNDISY